MLRTHRLAGLLGFAALFSACSGTDLAVAPEQASLVESAGPLRLTGSGHHPRTVAGETDLTTFSFAAVRHADRSTTGRYQYEFRASGFAVYGPVTCVTTSGSQAWVGGVVDKVVTDDPDLAATLLGVDMWWRSKDLGEGLTSADSTTGLGFKFPTTTITAASWCRDQPPSLIMRAVENGNIQLDGN
jgi:hypothetical protein